MKILIYCTKAKPYLSKDIVSSGKYVLSNTKDYFNRGDLNGVVCFEGDCKEAFKYDFVHRSGDSSNFYIRDQRTERMKDCLSNDDLFDYGKGKTLYAYHFENVKPIYPMPITCLYKDEACTKPLTKAPQSYCFAYRIVTKSCVNADMEEVFEWTTEKYLVFSIRSPWLCKIANGEKDLEVRKTCPKEISRPNKCSK